MVAPAIADTGAAGPAAMGQVMKAVTPLVAGRAEGSRVAAEVRRALAVKRRASGSSAAAAAAAPPCRPRAATASTAAAAAAVAGTAAVAPPPPPPWPGLGGFFLGGLGARRPEPSE